MTFAGNGSMVIGETLDTTRRIKATRRRFVREGDRHGLADTDLDGKRRLLDVTDAYPQGPAERESATIPQIAQALPPESAGQGAGQGTAGNLT